jgi:hypothetical protein
VMLRPKPLALPVTSQTLDIIDLHCLRFAKRLSSNRWNRSTPKTNSAPLIEDARSDGQSDKFRNLLELSIKYVDPMGD